MRTRATFVPFPDSGVMQLPFPLPVIQAKDRKHKCCKKYQKGKDVKNARNGEDYTTVRTSIIRVIKSYSRTVVQS